jgi:hypothetical protein
LPSGRYYIVAGPLDWPVYYPGAFTVSGASMITVPPGRNFQADFAAPHGVVVSGRVIVHGDSTPLSDGPPAVTLQRKDRIGPITTQTIKMDAGVGTFNLPEIRPGEYFLSTSFLVPGVLLTVRDEDVAGVEIVVPRNVAIGATFIKESGEAFPAVSLVLSPDEGLSGFRYEIGYGVSMAQDNALVPEGRYRLWSEPPVGYYFKSLTAGSTDLLRAPLTLTESDSSIQIRGVLARAEPARVSGRVAGPSPLSINRDIVELKRKDYLLAYSKQVLVRSDGSFDLSGVMPGNYEATLILESGARSAATPVVVSGEDVAGVEIAFPALQEIVTRVSVEGGGPLPRFGRLQFRSADQTIQFDVYPPTADGTLHVPLPEGEYQIALIDDFTTPAEQLRQPIFRISDVMYGAGHLANQPMKVLSADSPELRVTLAPQPGSPRFKVAGRVMGTTAGNSHPERVSLAGSKFGSVEAPVEADGSFEFRQVPPDDYIVRIDSEPLTPHVFVDVIDKDVSGITISSSR